MKPAIAGAGGWPRSLARCPIWMPQPWPGSRSRFGQRAVTRSCNRCLKDVSSRDQMTHFPTPQERRALGRARRKQLARQEHSQWKTEGRRRGPVELLQESMRGRIPQLVTLKYERMLASPFGYFRGAVPVMAADLGTLPSTGIVNQICGDAHVRNLGAFAAPDGRLVFDINDFDETVAGPFEWDLKRMAASLILAGREACAK